jgi:hypothetical protein
MSEASTTTVVVPKQPSFLDKILVDNWKKCLTWMSVWGYGAVIASPEIFQLFMQLVSQFDGTTANHVYLPESFTTFLRTIGTLGLIVRMVRQSKQKIEDAAAALATAAEAAENAKQVGVLKGSSKYGEAVLVGGQAVLLTVAVQTAFERSGMTKEAWNDLTDEVRDAFIAAVIDPVLAAATPSPSP